MIDWSKEYNSAQEDITIPEYGRHVQQLVAHAKTIAHPRERQLFAERIVWLMMQIQPQSRNVEDYEEKLWKHLFRIANYELDVTPPDGIVVKPEDARKHPEKVDYPKAQIRMRHYGQIVQRMIREAIAMPEGPKREGYVAAIGAYMKLAYKTWNREHYVSDEVIKSDLETLSEGQIKLSEEMSLDNLGGNGKDRRRPQQNNQNQRQQRGGYGQNQGQRSSRMRQHGGGGGGRRNRK